MVKASAPFPPRISSQPWSIDLVIVLAQRNGLIMFGWVVIMLRNHIVEKKDLMREPSGLAEIFNFQIIRAIHPPMSVTVIVSNL